MEKFDVREWALKGAELRLVEIGQEATAIFRHFPELRGKGRGFDSASGSDGAAAGQKAKPPRRRRKMSTEARKAVADRMKKYWAARRGEGQGAGAEAATEGTGASPSPTNGTKTGRPGRARRKMSAAARKRISRAQKARWAKYKGENPAGTKAGGRKKK